MAVTPKLVQVAIGRLNQDTPTDNAIAGELAAAENVLVLSGNKNTGTLELGKREGLVAMPSTVYNAVAAGNQSFVFGAIANDGGGQSWFHHNGTGPGELSSVLFVPPAGTAVGFSVNITTSATTVIVRYEIYKNDVASGIFIDRNGGATGTVSHAAFSIPFDGSIDRLDVVATGSLESGIHQATFSATVTFSATGTAAIANARRLGTLDNALVIRTRDSLYSWVPAASAWKDHGLGRLANVSVNTRQVSSGADSRGRPSRAVGGGYEFVTWAITSVFATGAYYSVIDTTSGAYVVSDATLVSSAGRPRVVFASGLFIVFYNDLFSNRIKAIVISPTNPSDIVRVDDLGASTANIELFDVQEEPGGLVTYAFATSSTQVTLGFYNPATGTTSSVLTPSSVTPGADPVAGISWVIQDPWSSAPRKYFILFATDTLTTRAIVTWELTNTLAFTAFTVQHSYASSFPTANGSATGYLSTSSLGNVRVFHDDIRTFATASAENVYDRNVVIARSLRLASKPFTANGRWYLLCFYDSGIQATYFLMDVTDANARPVGKALAGAGSMSPGDFSVPVPLKAGNIASIPATQLVQSVPNAIEAFPRDVQAIDVAAFDFDGFLASQPKQLSDGSLHIPGSIPLEFDGARAVESGFLIFPEKPIGVASSGGSVELGVRNAIAVYSWVNARGEIQRSAPSPVGAVTVSGGNGTITWTLTSLTVTMRRNVSLELYRNTLASASIYYLLTAAPLPTGFDPSAQAGSSNTVQFVDTQNDATISARQKLYTGSPLIPAELEHLPPPPSRIVTTHKSRLFYAGVDTDPGSVWFSDEAQPGASPAFNDARVFRIDGAVTAMASTDNYLAIFTADTCWVVTGEFPASDGSGFIPTPFRLRHDVGVTTSGGVVASNDGVFFKSKKGILLLSPELAAEDVSKPIKVLQSSTAPDITAALISPYRPHVRFYTNGPQQTYVWEYDWKAWTTATGTVCDAVDALNWSGVPTQLASDGTVRNESTTTWQDTFGTFVPYRVLFSVMNLAGIRGYVNLMEVQFTGRFFNRCGMIVNLYVDGGSAIDATYTFTAQVAGPLFFAMRPKHRRISSLAIEITDTGLFANSNRGVSIEAVMLLVGTERGGRTITMPARNRAPRS